MTDTRCGEVLRRERERLAMAQNTLAALLRISPAYLCDIEFGRRSLSEDRIALLPDCMKWPVAKAMIREHETAIARLRSLAPQPFVVTCDDCGGEGGFYTPEATAGRWSDPTPGERWDECPSCHGSGWLDSDEPPPEVEPDELPPLRATA